MSQNAGFPVTVEESDRFGGSIVNHLTRELTVLGVLFALTLASIFWRYRHPQLYAANVVAPGNRFNRIQHMALIYMAIGVATTVAIPILNSFHLIDWHYRTSSLSESKMFVLVGAVTFLIGWNRRHKPDSPSVG
jgi:hypothetical protein